MGRLKHIAAGMWLTVLLFAAPGAPAFALAVVDTSLTVSSLSITSDSGSVSFEDPLFVQAGTNAFNSLGETDGDFNSDIDATVSANTAVTYAQGSATASAGSGAANGSVGAMASVGIPYGDALAGVTLPGSTADLMGFFDIVSLSTNPVTVTLSMQVSGLLHGMSDDYGFLQTGDITASLTIDGTPGLFLFASLPQLPSLTGINDYPDTIVPVSQTLTATVALDPTVSHFFDMEANAEAQAYNVPEPGTLSLVISGLGVLAWYRRGKFRRSQLR